MSASEKNGGVLLKKQAEQNKLVFVYYERNTNASKNQTKPNLQTTKINEEKNHKDTTTLKSKGKTDYKSSKVCFVFVAVDFLLVFLSC